MTKNRVYYIWKNDMRDGGHWQVIVTQITGVI